MSENVGGVSGNVNFQTLNPAELSQQDFISAVYVERGNMLDAEVRRIAGSIEQSNNLLNSIGTLTNKAAIAQYGPPDYKQTTWSVRDNNIVLDNGYSLSIQSGDDGTVLRCLMLRVTSWCTRTKHLYPLQKA